MKFLRNAPDVAREAEDNPLTKLMEIGAIRGDSQSGNCPGCPGSSVCHGAAVFVRIIRRFRNHLANPRRPIPDSYCSLKLARRC